MSESSPRQAALEAASARLKAAGLRLTRPRVAVLTELVTRGTPASIEEIHRSAGAARCDLVTVYRTVAIFEGIGLARRACFVDGAWMYAIDLGKHPRYHVVCRHSRRVEALDPESGAAIAAAIRSAEDKLRARGYTETGHVLEFFGVAPSRPAAGS